MKRADQLDLDELAARIAPLVLAKLATALGALQAPYSTRRGYEPPEYTGRATRWRADAPTIAGAVQLGRWWVVTREAYAAWIAAQASHQEQPGPPPPSTWTPATALAGAGLRPTMSPRGRTKP